jgi:isoquinoline 1-oxidoreductase alpha subunit
MAKVNLNVNGSPVSVTVDSLDTPLLWALRDSLGLTGTKYGCGRELCGACAVLINGQKQLSCDVDVGEVAGSEIWTIEGLAADLASPNPKFPSYAEVRKAWIDNQVPQCGFCQSGMIIAAVSLLESGKSGSAAAAAMDHLCVCGTYPRINKALRSIA